MNNLTADLHEQDMLLMFATVVLYVLRYYVISMLEPSLYQEHNVLTQRCIAKSIG